MRNGLTNIKNTVVNVYTDITSHWKYPAKGNYVPYKEVAKFGVSGMGRDMVMYLLTFMALSAGNTFLGSAIGIRPVHLQTIQMAATLFGLVWLSVRGAVIDNIRTKWGKFRPLIAATGAPLAILTIVFMFLDLETMTYSKKLLCVIGFALSIDLIKATFFESFTGLGQLMTPNTAERTKVITIFTFMYSIAPTIYNFFVPMLSQLTGGLTSVATYRYIVAPIGVIGVALTFFAVFGCKERTIKSKTYVQKVNIFKGMSQVFRNKYWWIRNVSAWFTFLEGASSNIFAWMFIYGVQDMTTYSFVVTIVGFSATIAMVLTPLLLSKIGNRKLIILQNTSNILFISCMFLTYTTPALFVIFLFVNNLVNYFGLIYNPVMDGEVKDYQHYLCGKRVDGCFTAAAVINIPIALVTGFAIPFLYERFGLTVNYDILYDAVVRKTMFNILLGISIVGAVINLLPYFFYDYSREKHASVIRVLRLRALLEDYADKTQDNELVKQGIEDYYKAIQIRESSDADIKVLRSTYRNIRKEKPATLEEKAARHEKYKRAKAEYLAAKKMREDKKQVYLYWDEFRKYDTPANALHLQFSGRLAEMSYEELVKLSHETDAAILAEIYCGQDNALATKPEKRVVRGYKKKLLKFCKNLRKYFSDGIVEGDRIAMQKAIDMPENQKSEIRAKKAAWKRENGKFKVYNKVMEFYLDEVRNVKVAEGMCNFTDIEALYPEACAEAERRQAAREAEESRVKAEKKAGTAEIKMQRKKKKDERSKSKRNKNSDKR